MLLKILAFYSLTIMALCFAAVHTTDSSISFSFISGPTPVRTLSEAEFETAMENAKPFEKDYSRMSCGNQHMKHEHDVDELRQQFNPSQTFDQFQSGCQITQCDVASTRNTYDTSTTYGLQLEFWIDSSLEGSVVNQLPSVVAFTNQKYASAGIKFKAVQYIFTSSVSGTYYVNSPCDSRYSQPCYDASSILQDVIQKSGVRSTIKTNGTLAILVANTQRMDEDRLILGYAFFPWSSDHGMMVMIPETVRPGDITAPHEIGHFLGLYHSFHGIDEVQPCGNCYEVTSTDSNGDLCADTPPFPNTVSLNTCSPPSTSLIEDPCPTARSSRGSTWPAAGMQNIMSYVLDSCASVFTGNQQKRMRCYADRYTSAQSIDPNDPSYPSAASSTVLSFSMLLFLYLFL